MQNGLSGSVDFSFPAYRTSKSHKLPRLRSAVDVHFGAVCGFFNLFFSFRASISKSLDPEGSREPQSTPG